MEQLLSERQDSDSDFGFSVAPRSSRRPALDAHRRRAPGRLRVSFEPALSWLGHLFGLAKRIKAAARGVDAALGTNEAAATAKRAARHQPWGSAFSRQPSSRPQRTAPAKHA